LNEGKTIKRTKGLSRVAWFQRRPLTEKRATASGRTYTNNSEMPATAKISMGGGTVKSEKNDWLPFSDKGKPFPQ
jgi:hypothetical protein